MKTSTCKDRNYYIVGLGFGDEGKGSCLRYIYDKNTDYKIAVKYSGGCNGQHTIRYENGSFSYAQLSPILMRKDTTEVIDSGFIFEPFSLLTEIKAFAEFTKMSEYSILHRIYIDEETVVVTPIHKIYNRVEELYHQEHGDARGSVGTGVSIAALYSDYSDIKKNSKVYVEPDIVLRVKDLKDPDRVLQVLKNQRDYFSSLAFANEYETRGITSFNVYRYVADVVDMFRENVFNIKHVHQYFNFRKNTVFESSQGIMIDRRYGVRPNTTYLKVIDTIPYTKTKIGVIRAIYTRHGPGAFPTYSDELSDIFTDDTQEFSKYFGRIRFGWFDSVLYRYTQSIYKPDEIFMTCLDFLKELDVVNVCTRYKYLGNKEDLSQDCFEIETDGEDIYIKNILKNTDDLKGILDNSVPYYTEVDLTDLSFEKKIEKYVNFINSISNAKVKYFSVGENFSDVGGYNAEQKCIRQDS